MPGWLTDHFQCFDFPALWRSGLSARVPESRKLKMTTGAVPTFSTAKIDRSGWHPLSQGTKFVLRLCVILLRCAGRGEGAPVVDIMMKYRRNSLRAATVFHCTEEG